MIAKHLLVLCSPSGGGKSTVARHILRTRKTVRFSVSATTRAQRPKEIPGKDYHFLTKDDFQSKIAADELAEYEEIFGNYYGTLKSEINTAVEKGHVLLFDVDVKGAFNLKKAYPDATLTVFLAPVSTDVLEKRLRKRNTETDEQIRKRLERAKMEIEMSKECDVVIINDVLQVTLDEIDKLLDKNGIV